MESWQQMLAAFPMLAVFWDSVKVCLPLFALLAYSGIFFISTGNQIIAISRKRSAYNKCARQIAFLGLIMGWILLAGGRIWLYYFPALGENDINGFTQETSWLLFSIGVLLASIFYALWRPLKNMPVLHTTIGMIASVTNILALAAILCAIRLDALASSPEMRSLSLPDLFPNTWNDPLYSIASYTLPLMFAYAGGLSACWLVIRRHKEDFGRDYYNRMIPSCCAWARNSWIILVLLLLFAMGLQFYQQTPEPDIEEMIYNGARALLWLIPILLWSLLMRSTYPLRRSFLCFIAIIIACAFTMPYFLELTLI